MNILSAIPYNFNVNITVSNNLKTPILMAYLTAKAWLYRLLLGTSRRGLIIVVTRYIIILIHLIIGVLAHSTIPQSLLKIFTADIYTFEARVRCEPESS